MKPPVLARALLVALAGEAEAECVAGDLEEEFADLSRTRGPCAVNRWYLSQVVRSILPLLRLRVQSGELSRLVLSAMLGVALPLLLLDRLWSLVYSQIPLKDGVDRAPWFLAVNVLALCLGAAIGGSPARSIHRAASSAIAAIAAAGVAMWASSGSAPSAYVFVVLLLAPASSIFSYALSLRRSV